MNWALFTSGTAATWILRQKPQILSWNRWIIQVFQIIENLFFFPSWVHVDLQVNGAEVPLLGKYCHLKVFQNIVLGARPKCVFPSTWITWVSSLARHRSQHAVQTHQDVKKKKIVWNFSIRSSFLAGVSRPQRRAVQYHYPVSGGGSVRRSRCEGIRYELTVIFCAS